MLPYICAIAAVIIAYFYFKQTAPQPREEKSPAVEIKEDSIPEKTVQKLKKVAKTKKPVDFNHEKLVTTLKGHTDTIRSISGHWC